MGKADPAIKGGLITIILATLAACGNQKEASLEQTPAANLAAAKDPMLTNLAPPAGLDVSADFINPEGGVIGKITLTDSNNGVLFRVDLESLSKGWHGIHLHQVGDCSDGAAGFKASKSHINPDGNEHGLLNIAGFERADMPNIYARDNGRATAEIFNSYVRLKPSEAAAAAVGDGGILSDADGFAIIVHANQDDHQTQKIGGAGARVACAAFN